MILSLIAIFAVAFITYLWSIRGFFSAFLHMVCIVVAGAVAFGLWEPIAYFMLERSPRGFFGDSAWGLSLALPFALVAIVLRLASDKLIPQNAQAGTAMDYVGGTVCGLIAAIVSTGVMVISLQYLRMPHESWATYRAVDYTEQGMARGSLEKNKAFLRPYVDEITAALYNKLSMGAFSTPTPMAELQPDVAFVSSGMRMNYSESSNLGQSRNTVAPQDFDLIKTYYVGDPARPGSTGKGGITEDAQQPGIPQGYVDLEGNPITSGYLAGFVVQFKAGAKEESGQIVIGNGQISLVVESSDGTDHKTLFPLAVISQADSSSTDLGRWRFEADRLFVASVGGASQAPFAFEFLVPAGYTPQYLYVKNVRTDVSGEPDEKFTAVSRRDAAIRSGAIVKEGGGGSREPLNRSEATVVADGAGVQVRNAINRTIQRGNHGSLSIEEHGRSYWVVNGDHVFSRRDVDTRITEQSLRIDSLAVTEGTVVVKIDVSPGSPSALTSRAAATADPTQPPMVVDSLGQRLQAVGWIYEDGERFHLRYTPGRPLESINEAPALSTSRQNQKMELLFLCNYETYLESFIIGNKVIVSYDPPIYLDAKQN